MSLTTKYYFAEHGPQDSLPLGVRGRVNLPRVFTRAIRYFRNKEYLFQVLFGAATRGFARSGQNFYFTLLFVFSFVNPFLGKGRLKKATCKKQLGLRLV